MLFKRGLEVLEIACRPERKFVHVELARQGVAAGSIAVDVETRVTGELRARAPRADIRTGHELLAGRAGDNHRPIVKAVRLHDPTAEVIGPGSPWKEQALDVRVRR